MIVVNVKKLSAKKIMSAEKPQNRPSVKKRREDRG